MEKNKNNLMEEIVVFKKMRETKNGKVVNKFPTYFALYDEDTISVKFVMDAPKQLEDLGVEFPAKINIERSDYFPVREEYIDRHNEKSTTYKLCIKNIQAWEKAEIPSLSIEEIMKLKQK